MSTRTAPRPAVLIVRDGWGENPHPDAAGNAVRLAAPRLDARLREQWPFTLISTSGPDVGLPEGTPGNSEVGHHVLGAGRLVEHESIRISRTIRDGSFFRNPELVAAVETCLARNSALHLLGLCSDTGVHARLEHMLACVELAARRGLSRVYLHCFTDGRDAPPNSGVAYLAQVEAELRRIGVGHIASVCGRYYALDRDNRWDRVAQAYALLVEGHGQAAPNATAAVQRYYRNPTAANMAGDEFVEPTVISTDGRNPLATIRSKDAVIFTNFRGDRPRQLTRAFVSDPFPYPAEDAAGRPVMRRFERPELLDLFFVTLTEYDPELPVKVAFPRPGPLVNTAGEYLSMLGLRQFRCAETEKYPHVTYFFNDAREAPFAGEERRLIPSPAVATYDQQPEMSAYAVADVVLQRLAEGVDDLIVVNFANPDMVGHTGSLPATVRACQVVDECVGRVLEAVDRARGCAVVCADHGNAEQMIDPQTGGPHTAHTSFPVPLHLYGAELRGVRLRAGGRLADVLPTVLALLGLDIPPEMTGRPLMEC